MTTESPSIVSPDEVMTPLTFQFPVQIFAALEPIRVRFFVC